MSAAVVCRKRGLSYFDEIASPSLPPPYCSSVSKRLRHHHVDAATASSQVPLPHDHPKNMSEWVDVFVSQMAGASTMDDAKARASRMLEVWEKSICSHASMEASAAVETLTREKQDRQKEYDGMTEELQQSKQLLAQYQEQVSSLELDLEKYGLSVQLRQATTPNNSIVPGRFYPDDGY
ncbi:hypothetical protein MKW94_028140 [Papaver nudicaule]|uniref:Uncharacterized protein n=1 Tax=Papaver nudicaule TaxID=74823 RepID=A0AA41V4M8_PAPNU|nr:hypothetical protein [Papaver nudicaule]